MSAPVQQTQPEVKPVEKVAPWWWILPVVLTWLGGAIAFLALRKKNFKTARNMLIFGVVWAIIIIPTLAFLFGFFIFFIL
jgi:cobalamin biosynthesis protein CobD/CbiB